MRKFALAAGVILTLATVVSAFASSGNKVEWWPGEPPTPSKSGSLSGTIVNVTPTSLTLQTENNGTPIFTVNASTIVTITGKRATLANLNKGDKVNVSYTTLADGNVWAKSVTIPSPPKQKTSGSIIGRVASISSTAIAIGTENSETKTFGITPKTVITVKGQRAGLGQIKSQDPAFVSYRVTSGGLVAQTIRVLAEGIGPHLSGSVSGTVGAIGPSTITVQTVKNGAQTFDITPQTVVKVYDRKATTDQVKPGAKVSVGYKILDDGTRIASSISVPIPTLTGKVVSVDADGFVLHEKSGDIPIAVNGSTKVTAHTYTGSLSDIKPGDHVSAKGIPDGGIIRASSVEFHVPVVKGVVQSASDDTVVVKTVKQKTVNVLVSDTTAILVRPRAAPNYKGSIGNITPGTPVDVGGHAAGQNTTSALWIDLLVP